MSTLITRAAEFAEAAHGSIDQRRKYTNEPYIAHPEAVAATVASVSNDETMIAAAWLHDVVEDTPVEIEEIEEQFGEDVAALVSDLTNPSIASDGNRRQRKAKDREHTASADPRAKTIKLADVIDNLSGISSLDPRFARIYLEEKELQLQVLVEGNPELFDRAKTVIANEKRSLSG